MIVYFEELLLLLILCWGADKSLLAFPIFLFAAQPKEFFLDRLKKLEQRSHKCVELRGEYVNIFFFSFVACFPYKAKDLSAPLRTCSLLNDAVSNP
jgi:hypothetical protein